MSLIVTWILATKPKIVSLKINKIIAERAPSVAKKAPTSFPDIIEKITIQTTGNATNFGSITQSNDGSNGAGA